MRRWPADEQAILLTRWRDEVPVKFIARELKREPEVVRAYIAWLRAKGEHSLHIRRSGRPKGSVRPPTDEVVPPGVGEVRCLTVAPATIYDAQGRAVATLDPMTRERTRL